MLWHRIEGRKKKNNIQPQSRSNLYEVKIFPPRFSGASKNWHWFKGIDIALHLSPPKNDSSAKKKTAVTQRKTKGKAWFAASPSSNPRWRGGKRAIPH